MFYERDFRLSHNLRYLIDLLSEVIPINDAEVRKAVVLNGYSVEIKYPNTSIQLSEEDIENALSIADYFIEKAIAIIREHID